MTLQLGDVNVTKQKPCFGNALHMFVKHECPQNVAWAYTQAWKSCFHKRISAKAPFRSLIFRWCAYVRGSIPACDRPKTIWRDTLNVLLVFHQYHGVCAQISMFCTQKHLRHSIPTSPTCLGHQNQHPCWIRAQKKNVAVCVVAWRALSGGVVWS